MLEGGGSMDESAPAVVPVGRNAKTICTSAPEWEEIYLEFSTEFETP